jgi:hypothetical protein
MSKKNIYIQPPEYPELEYGKKIIFLAGPIQGAPDWQSEAIKLIHRTNPKILVASPRRFHDCYPFVYEQQVDWETYWLNEAHLIMFWCAKEEKHFCDRSYAQTTRFEIGEWKQKYKNSKTRLVVGVESGFTNERYLKRRFNQDCPDITIHSSLENTCKDAVNQIKGINTYEYVTKSMVRLWHKIF